VKKILLVLTLAFTINANAQDDKTVTLVVSGSGKTQDEAKQNALRSAIEQAFGTFISSKTEILNDDLVKDEMVSVTNGNIQKFDIISEVQIPEGGFATTLNATVSVTKLTSFVESKGIEVEFKGALFAMNIKLLKLNAEAEYMAILDLCSVSKEILSKGLDYSLQVSEPQAYNGSTDKYTINFEVNCTPNNLGVFEEYFWSTLPKIAMTTEEKLNYDKIKVPVSIIFKQNNIANTDYLNNYNFGPITTLDSSETNRIMKENRLIPIFLRNPKSLIALKNLFVKSNDQLLNFRITSEVDTVFVKKTNNRRDNTGKWILSGGYPKASSCSHHNFSLGWLFYNRDRQCNFKPLWNLYYDFINNSNINDVEKLLDEKTYFKTTGIGFSFEIERTTSWSTDYIGNNGIWDYALSSNEVLKTGDPLVLYENFSSSNSEKDMLKNELDRRVILNEVTGKMEYMNETKKASFFTFRYTHVIDFQALEKISRYKIEPFQNKP
jgi:hypothetical protein